MLATGGSQMLGSAIGNHVLTKVLGEGAMGTVYYAEHAHLGGSSARVYKLLRPELTTSP